VTSDKRKARKEALAELSTEALVKLAYPEGLKNPLDPADTGQQPASRRVMIKIILRNEGL
jgi:hypothetical protein